MANGFYRVTVLDSGQGADLGATFSLQIFLGPAVTERLSHFLQGEGVNGRSCIA